MLPQVDRPGTLEKVITSLQAVLKLLRPFEDPEPWQPAAFTTGWENYGAGNVQSRKDALGQIYLRGACVRTSGALTQMFVLPISHRPRVPLSIVGISSNLVCRLDVGTDGTVAIGAGGAPASWVSLAGITFDTRA